MPRLSMNELTTYRWSFEEDVIRYAQAGYPAIGVWRQKLSDYGEEKGKELLIETGLAVSNLLWAGGFTGSDGRSYRESVEDAEEAIQLAGELGASSLVVYTGGRGGHTVRHARRLVLEALGELAGTASQFGVTLALEPMHAACCCGCTFLTSLAETIDLIDELPPSHVGFALDTYHLGEDAKLLDQIAEVAPRVAIVHLGDSRLTPRDEQNRCPLGEGNLPLPEILRALLAAGYDGDFDVELLGEEIESNGYEHLLAHSKDAFERILAEAIAEETNGQKGRGAEEKVLNPDFY